MAVIRDIFNSDVLILFSRFILNMYVCQYDGYTEIFRAISFKLRPKIF